jgi:hypothetical protein
VRPAAAARARAWAASLTAVTSLVATGVAGAQTTGTVDIGASTIRYDGFLPSAAASLTPTVTWERPGAIATVRGTYLRFESGHRSLQGLVAASAFTQPGRIARPWRGEISVSAGGSDYADFASFWHATAEARLHFMASGRGGWIGAAGGRTSYGTDPRPVAVVSVGAWMRRARLSIAASANRAKIGDTIYSDLTSTLHASRGRVDVDASVGARVVSRGAGRGVYGEASTLYTVGERIALFVSGGRYPTDPISGSVAGRYLTAGVRLRATMPRPPQPPPLPPPPARTPRPYGRSPASGDGDPSLTPQLDIAAGGDGSVRLLISAPWAARVELAADFTDWQPVSLRRMQHGSWEAVLHIEPGVHRVNVRIDGGSWAAPAGTTRAADEFGGEVGLVTVP